MHSATYCLFWATLFWATMFLSHTQGWRAAIALVILFGVVLCYSKEASSQAILDNNLQVVDLSDLDGDLPLEVVSSTQILWQTQNWEHSTLGNSNWPSGGHESLGFPARVKNIHGTNPDGKYYLYYAHHDPTSGIGVAVANSITGPYTKPSIAHEVLGSGWTDSQVLVNPLYRPGGMPVNWIGHYSSPSVVWNEDEDLWFMYFHYYNHYWGGAGEPPGESWSANNPGLGQQMTALATTPDLSSHNWTIETDPAWSRVSAHDIVPVLPTTEETWMESQSSYHAIGRLPDGQWLAFLRGTSSAGGPTVGFGTSEDGRNWDYFPENPVIAPGKSWTVDTSEYRPKFIGYLGENGSGEEEYLVAWAEHSHPRIIYSKTTDFKTFQRDPRGYANWGTGDDGPVSVTREADSLYLFSGKFVHTMPLSVTATATDFTWTGSSFDHWAAPEEWSPTGVPGGNDVTARFTGSSGTTMVVQMDQAQTVQQIHLDGASSYSLVGSGPLELHTDSVDPQLVVTGGEHHWAVPVNALADTTIDISLGASLALDNTFGFDGVTVAKQGSGTLFLNGPEATGDGLLEVLAGTVSGNGMISGDLNMIAGSVAAGPGPGNLDVKNFTLGGNAKLQVEIAGSTTSSVDRIDVVGVANLDGVLEVALIDDYLPELGRQFLVLTASQTIDNGLTLSGPAAEMFDMQIFSFGIVLETVLAGDYSGNGVVDAADYTVWRDSRGHAGADLPADGTGDGVVYQADYTYWKTRFSDLAGGSDGGTVPEPGVWVILGQLTVISLLVSRDRRTGPWTV